MDLETAERMEKYLYNALAKYCIPKHCMAVGETRRQESHPKSLEMLCLIDIAQGHPPAGVWQARFRILLRSGFGRDHQVRRSGTHK